MNQELKPSLQNPQWLYIFLGFHSFLIGLFPVYIAVYLWKQSYDLSSISLFIAIGAFGFICTLWVWDRLHKRVRFQELINISFGIQAIMLSTFFWTTEPWFLLISAFTYGISNCFFWVTQRAMFLEYIDPMSSGKKFGNLQIFVFLIIQVSIFLGGYLLETQGFSIIFISSIFISVIALSLFQIIKKTPQLPKKLIKQAPLNFKDIRSFTDTHHSVSNFLIDGPFLFLEGFFWSISLFLMTKESFLKLGIIIIVLALSFAISFYLIKNKIDHLPQQKTYTIAVLLYSFSWILRAISSSTNNFYILGLTILVITFCTSFFRLSYNKRFFDLAHRTKKHTYLFLKSYYSQFGILILFGIFTILFKNIQNQQMLFKSIYWISALISLLYLSYKTSENKIQIPSSPTITSFHSSKTTKALPPV